jgi:hypothetical protein
MENQQQPSQKTGEIEIPDIGIRKYEYLKSLKPELRTETQKQQIETFEAKKRQATPEQIDLQHNYFDKIHAPKDQKEFSISARHLWELFKYNFEKVNKRPFEKVAGITIPNLEPLIYYFSKDDRFFECKNLSKLSEPSFDKGLLIIGTFGNGKTSTMKVFEHIFKGISGITFKGYSANEAVVMFEKCSSDILRDEFEKTMFNGNRYFDDVKTERMASNFGKVNIFKEIFEERYNRMTSKNIKTFITCNYKDGFEGDIEVAVDEFGEKYGGRVYDRIFEMYNIILFEGKSFRK